MNLRPHHLLCIQKFSGYGYNADFISHMKNIVLKLIEDPISPITISEGCDELCKMCPQNIKGICKSLEKVNIMDGSILEICDIAYGDSVSWIEIAYRVHKKIFEMNRFKLVCAYCQWFTLCSRTNTRWIS